MRSILLRICGIAVFNRTRPKANLPENGRQKKGIDGLLAIGIEADSQRQKEGKNTRNEVFFALFFGSVLAR
jgi:hypothetical protein